MAIAKAVLRSLFCWKTTEQGHDEVYALVAVRHSNGSTRFAVLPGGDGDADEGRAWDMNDADNDPKKDRHLNYPLWAGVLDPGQSVDVLVVFMESDNTNYGDAAQAAGGLLAATGDPIAMAAGAVLSAVGPLLPENKNERLGGLGVVMYNNHGRLEWQHAFHNDDPARASYRFNDVANGVNPGGGDNGFFVHLRNVDGGDGSYDCYMNVFLTP